MNPLRKALQDYLEMRRGLGFKLQSQGQRLSNFLRFIERRKAAHITTALALEWARQSKSAGSEQWFRLITIRPFARYCSAADSRTEVPPPNLIPRPRTRLRPYLYTEDEIQRLLKAALNLRFKDDLKTYTYYCLFGLLAVSGLRIGEALRLKNEDVDLVNGVLNIRESKFGKSRLVPLHPTTQKVLNDYRNRRDRHLNGRTAAQFFISRHGTPLSHPVVYNIFNLLSVQVGLRDPSASHGPRLHDFRHRFAVWTLLRWYRSDEDIEPRLPLLSTYLGHTCIANTYWYLTSCPELMALAVKRLEQRWEVEP